MKTESFEVLEEQEGERLDKFLSIIYHQSLIFQTGIPVD